MIDRRTRVVVVGGGIGGLALAAALRVVGFEPRVFEQAPELREVGAGLGLWANAVRALDAIDCGEWLRATGQPIATGGMGTWDGRELSRTDFRQFAGASGASCYVVHRADLHAALAAKLPAGVVTLGATCTGVETLDDRLIVRFTELPPVEADIVVGADGIHSPVRASLWGETTLRYSGQTCWRGIAHFRSPEPDVIREVWGRGQRCAACTIDRERVYWWAAMNAPAGEPGTANDLEFLRERYAGWHFGIDEALAATKPGTALKGDLYDRVPLTKWRKGRATLLGDAAHPTTPNLGQGACMALEDAIILARCLATEPTPEAALDAYERERIPRTTSIVNQSWNFGRLAAWQSPPALWLREALVRMTPRRVLVNQIRSHIDFDCGRLPT